MLARYALLFHIVGAILWIGGALAAATVAATGAGRESAAAALDGARTALLRWATPGMLIAWIAGLTMLIPSFTTLYAKAGWMHGKLTLLLVASALTGVLTGRIRKAAKGEKPASAGLMNGLAAGLLLVALMVVALAVLKPGA